jgi:hypothetical protein
MATRNLSSSPPSSAGCAATETDMPTVLHQRSNPAGRARQATKDARHAGQGKACGRRTRHPATLQPSLGCSRTTISAWQAGGRAAGSLFCTKPWSVAGGVMRARPLDSTVWLGTGARCADARQAYRVPRLPVQDDQSTSTLADRVKELYQSVNKDELRSVSVCGGAAANRTSTQGITEA